MERGGTPLARQYDDDLFDLDLLEDDDDEDLFLLDPEAGTFQSAQQQAKKSSARSNRSRDREEDDEEAYTGSRKGERRNEEYAPSRGGRTVLIILVILVVGVAAVLGLMQATGGEPLKFLHKNTTVESVADSVAPETEAATPAPQETEAVSETPEASEPVESQSTETLTWDGEGLALMQTVSDSFTLDLVEVDNLGRTQDGGNHQVDATVASALEEFLDAAHDAGYGTMLSTCYREGTTEEDALDVQEHGTGLAVDLVDVEAQMKEIFAEEQTDQIQWLTDHAADYGFILRFPQGKEEETGSEYIPYHFVYVGKAVAQDMAENDLCLEEYLAQ
jgi:D-alanyl-D-alanine carboxypeptidase